MEPGTSAEPPRRVLPVRCRGRSQALGITTMVWDAVARQPQQARVTEGSSSSASRSSSTARSNDPAPEGIRPSPENRAPGSEAGRGAVRADEIPRLGRPSREADDLLRPLTRYTQSTPRRPVDTGLLLRGLDRFSGPVGVAGSSLSMG